MKILHINEKFGPFGGTEQYLSQVMPAQVGQSHSVGILFDQRTKMGFQLKGVVQYEFKGLSEPKGAPGGHHDVYHDSRWQGFIRALESFEPDIINLHNWRNLTVVEELLQNYPVLWYCHDHYFTCLQSPPSRYFEFLGRADSFPPDWRCAILSAVDGKLTRSPLNIYRHTKNKAWQLSVMRKIPQIIVISGYMRETLLQTGFRPDQVTVVPRQVRTLPEEISPLPNQGHLLFVGRVEKEKGLRVLLETLGQLPDIDCELRVAGNGSDLDYCRRLTRKLGLEDKVEFLGYQPDQPILELYNWTDIVVFPSVWPEPFGVVGIEAMAYARPVVGFDVGGTTEWLKDGYNGLVAKYNDAKDMAEKIARLVADPEYAARLGRSGREMVKAKHTLASHLGYLDNLYRKLLHR